MNYKIKIVLLSLLILIKVTFFWNIGYSYIVIFPLGTLLCFAIIFSVIRLVNFIIGNHLYSKNQGNPIASSDPTQVEMYLEMLRRRDLSRFFEVFFALPILINLLEFVYLKSLSSGHEIMSNSVLAIIIWIVIDMINGLTTNFIQKRTNRTAKNIV